MTNDLGDIIIYKLQSLPWFDKYTSVVKILSYQSKNKQGNNVIKKMPVSCQTTAEDCTSGRYIDLCPNSDKKSVVFLKDKGTRFVSRNGDKYSWRSSLDLVVWLNLPKLGYEGCSYSGIAITGVLSKLPSVPFQITGSIYQRVSINLDGQLPNTSNPFAEYSFPEEITQYLMYPYEAFTLPISVDFMTNRACLDVPYIPQQLDCIIK